MNEERHTFRGRWAVFVAFIRNPWVVPLDFAVALMAVHLFPAIFHGTREMSSALTSLWATILALPNNAIFQLGFLITALACAWNGVRKIEGSTSKAIDRNASIQAAERAAIKAEIESLFAPHKAILDHYVAWRQLEAAKGYLQIGKSRMEHRQEHLKRFDQDEWSFHFAHYHEWQRVWRYGDIRETLQNGFAALGDQSVIPEGLSEEPNRADSREQDHHQIYRKNENGPFLDALSTNNRYLSRGIEDLGKLAAVRDRELTDARPEELK